MVVSVYRNIAKLTICCLILSLRGWTLPLILRTRTCLMAFHTVTRLDKGDVLVGQLTEVTAANAPYGRVTCNMRAVG